MTHKQEQEFRRLAQAATPGPWTVDAEFSDWNMPRAISIRAGGDEVAEIQSITPNPIGDKPGHRRAERDNANAAFIAAANPQAILSLIERLEALEEAVKGAHVIAEQAGEVLRANKGTVRLTVREASNAHELFSRAINGLSEKNYMPFLVADARAALAGLAAAIKEAQGE